MNPVEKANKLRERKNEVARAMRARRGEELREKQREYVRKNREKVKKEAEEYIQQIAKEEIKKEVKKEVKKQVKKTETKKQEQPEIKLEKDKGEMKSRAERLGEKGVSEKTAKDYISKISVIHKVFSKDDLDKELLQKILLGNGTDKDEDKLLENMKYIKDVDTLIETITKKYENIQSRKGYIAPFLTLTSYLKCLNKINYEKIRIEFEKVNNEIYGIRKENEKPKTENLIDDFDEETILELSKKLGSEDKVIYQFYTLQAPRRNDDVVRIEIIKEGYDKEKLDKKKNYIVIDENNIPNELIYNYYKTKKVYGKQTITITNENLQKTIQRDILRHQKKEGDKLFKYSRADTFGKAIARVFTKVYNMKITLNTIRHSYITWEMREVRNVRYLENLAMLMGHSPKEQQLYRRI
tara:strand:+ start:160 stop:1392 length:1233 start_codon:yes stop_codon:yes gene_type:complete